MIQMRFLILAVVLILLAATPACSGDDDVHFQVGIKNLTTGDVNGTTFHSPTLDTGVGFLAAADYKTTGPFSGDLPAEGDVQWTSADGKQHSVHVKIPPKPKPFDGMLWLKIMPDGTAAAVPLTDDECFNKHIQP